MLTFEYRACPDVGAQGLGCDFLDVRSPCHPSVEDDTEIFDTIYKWDVQSIQLKVVPRHLSLYSLASDHSTENTSVA
jgi:hypothetical protein